MTGYVSGQATWGTIGNNLAEEPTQDEVDAAALLTLPFAYGDWVANLGSAEDEAEVDEEGNEIGGFSVRTVM